MHCSPWLHIQYCPFSNTGCTFTHFLLSVGCFRTFPRDEVALVCVWKRELLLEREDFMCMKVHFPNLLYGDMECLLPFLCSEI